MSKFVVLQLAYINGEIANEWCPVTQREWYRPGTEPTHICTEHSAPLIDRLDGSRSKSSMHLGRCLKMPGFTSGC